MRRLTDKNIIDAMHCLNLMCIDLEDKEIIKDYLNAYNSLKDLLFKRNLKRLNKK